MTYELYTQTALQTVNILDDTISRHLLVQPCIEYNSKWFELASSALHAIEELRIEIGIAKGCIDDLRTMIATKSYITGNFLLASGTTSNVFFDLKVTMLDPRGANLIGDAVMLKLQSLRNVQVIGGLAVGAVPIVTMVCAKSFGSKRPLRGFYVRKTTKDHGTEQLIDGVDVAGCAVTLIEDVSTTGASLLTAAKAVREAGGYIDHAITIVDRLEGATENLALHDITLHAIFTRDDFIK